MVAIFCCFLELLKKHKKIAVLRQRNKLLSGCWNGHKNSRNNDSGSKRKYRIPQQYSPIAVTPLALLAPLLQWKESKMRKKYMRLSDARITLVDMFLFNSPPMPFRLLIPPSRTLSVIRSQRIAASSLRSGATNGTGAYAGKGHIRSKQYRAMRFRN